MANKEFDNVQLFAEYDSTVGSSVSNIFKTGSTDTSKENIAWSLSKIKNWFPWLVPTNGSTGQILEWYNNVPTWRENTNASTVKQTHSTDTDYHPLVLGAPHSASTWDDPISETTDQVYMNNGVYVKPYTSTIYATDYRGKINGFTLNGTEGSTYNLNSFITSQFISSITTTGNGNGVTAIGVNNGVMTVTKGSTFALDGHTHPLSIATDTGDSQLSMLANTKYKLTAGGSTFIFTTPQDSDTKVTSSANHYTPSTASGQDKTASASGATAAWSIDVVKGVTLNTDGKGHVTGISVTSGKIPANPVPSNNVTGSGTSGYLTKWNGTNTITNGPQLGSSTTTFLRNDGTWATPPVGEHTHAYTVPVGITIKTGSSDHSHITLQMLMTWLITTKGYITSNTARSLTLYTSWSYAGNDILQLTIDGTAYELQLAGVIIEFDGFASDYQTGTFRLRIHSSPTVSFTPASGYTQFPTSHIAEYTCNGSGYSPTWKMLVDKGDTVTRTGGGASGTWGISISGSAAKLGTANKGSTTKGIYLSGGTPQEMTYSLGSTVNGGTANCIAYYSGANAISSAAKVTYVNANNSASTPATVAGLHIESPTYGNTAANMIGGVAGVLSYGDGGPQIRFKDGSSTQAGALIFTADDAAASGTSWHFVSNETDWNVISKRFHAKTSISIGTDKPSTSYNLTVNGTSYFNNTITIKGTSSGNASIYYASYGNTRNSTSIRFYDGDVNGQGIQIGGGGLTVLGGGESAQTVFDNLSTLGLTTSSEAAVIASDGPIYFYTNVDTGIANRKAVSINTSGYLNTYYINMATSDEDNSFSSSSAIIYSNSDKYLRRTTFSKLASLLQTETTIYDGHVIHQNDYNSAGFTRPVHRFIRDLRPNKLAFTLPANITMEYSTNAGSSWTSFGYTDAQKAGPFISRHTGGSIAIGPTSGERTTSMQTRITITNDGRDCFIDQFYIWISTSGHGTTVDIQYTTQSAKTTWVDWRTNVSVAGWAGPNIINVSELRYGNTIYSIRFTFKITSIHADYKTQPGTICDIQAYGGMGCWGSKNNMMTHDSLFTWDYGQNATFPANVSATKFIGPLQGNADTATTATNAYYLSDSVAPSTYRLRYINSNDVTTWTTSSLAATDSIAVIRGNVTDAWTTGHIVTFNVASVGTPFQIGVHDSSELYFYKRYKTGSSTWSSWTKMNAGYADSAGTLSHKTLNSTTINNTAGSFAFSGSGDPWAGTDWVGLQIGDSVDKWQISGTGTSLVWRQNDNGGTDSTGWSVWKTVLDSSNYSSYALPLSGGTMTGDISFTTISPSSYPAASKGIKWSGGTDAIDMYYNLRDSDAGELIINMRDDANVRTSFAYNGTVKSYIDTDGTYNGNATTSSRAYSLYTGDVTVSTNSHATALQTFFEANKSTIVRNRGLGYYSNVSSNGSFYFGYFLSGYNDNPYGGFFVCHYNTPYYVGIQNGAFVQHNLLTNQNYASYITQLGTVSKGSTTKGIYLDAGVPKEMTYELKSTVNGGTANQLAYYSGANAISATHDGTNTVDSLYFKTGTNAKSARQIILGVYGQTYGNDAPALISGTAGVFSYGDGGPQIDFNTSSTGSQAGALIFTDHDSAATGASWHFVSNQTDWNVTSKRFHARSGISIGDTKAPVSGSTAMSYALYVNGTANITGNTTVGGTLSANAVSSTARISAAGQSNNDTALGNLYANGAYEVRESGRVDATDASQWTTQYAPRIGFHWGGRSAASISYFKNSDATDWYFFFKKQDGSTRATIDANVIGSLTGNITGNASGYSNTVYGIYTGSGGVQAPNYFGKNRVGFLMSNVSITGDTHYKNIMYMDCYSGTDVGGVTALAIDRIEARAWILQSDANRTAWNNTAAIGVFTATPTSGQVVVTDGTTGGIKSSGYTIAKSVPSNAVFTDHITTATTSGSGNAVTSITADANGALTVTKGSTFSLSTHTHDSLYAVQSSSAVPSTTLSAGQFKVFYHVNQGLTNNMPASNNANAIIQFNKHSGNYDSQLGFSSNGNIYYRNFNAETIGSQTWNTILASNNLEAAAQHLDSYSGAVYTSIPINPIAYPLAPFHRANKLMFMPSANITVEYSSDGGSTWTNMSPADTTKRDLFISRRGTDITIGPTSGDRTTSMMTRVIVECDGRDTMLDRFLLHVDSGYHSIAVDIYVATASAPTTYTKIATGNPSGTWAYEYLINIPHNITANYRFSNSNYKKIAFYFRYASVTAAQKSSISKFAGILAFSGTFWGNSYVSNNFAGFDHIYSWDRDQNAYFPAEVRVPTQLRVYGGSYGAIFRVDANNIYLLPTNANDPQGSWSSLVPFYISNSTGKVTMAKDAYVAGNLYARLSQRTNKDRQSTANLACTGTGAMQLILATSTMDPTTERPNTGKPASDGFILDFDWDNTGPYKAQIFVPNRGTYSMQWRGQTASSDWSGANCKWHTLIDSKGGTIEGNLTLYAQSGDSPSLIFKRGTSSDNLNDWKIFDSGGNLCFARSNTNEDSWQTIMSVTNTDIYIGAFTVSKSNHTHKYAGAPSAGGAAYNMNISRVSKDANLALPGLNQSVLEEFTGDGSSNLPSNAYYHVLSNEGPDSKWGTQLALGMTAEGAYYRRYYYSSGTSYWSSWSRLDVPSVIAGNEIRFFNGNQMTANNRFWFGYQWAGGSHYVNNGTDTASVVAPNITEYLFGNCSQGNLAGVVVKSLSITKTAVNSSNRMTIDNGNASTDRTLTMPDLSGTISGVAKIYEASSSGVTSTNIDVPTGARILKVMVLESNSSSYSYHDVAIDGSYKTCSVVQAAVSGQYGLTLTLVPITFGLSAVQSVTGGYRYTITLTAGNALAINSGQSPSLVSNKSLKMVKIWAIS